jgi:hypothetical protein
MAGTKSFCKARGRGSGLRAWPFVGPNEKKPFGPVSSACWLSHHRRAVVMHTARGSARTRATFRPPIHAQSFVKESETVALGSQQDKGRQRSEESSKLRGMMNCRRCHAAVS